MAYLRLRNEDPIAIYDRAFRLRHNASQVSARKKAAVTFAELLVAAFLVYRSKWMIIAK